MNKQLLCLQESPETWMVLQWQHLTEAEDALSLPITPRNSVLAAVWRQPCPTRRPRATTPASGARGSGCHRCQEAVKEVFVLLPWQRVTHSSALTCGAAGGEKRGVVGLETSPGDAAITAKQDGQLVPGRLEDAMVVPANSPEEWAPKGPAVVHLDGVVVAVVAFQPAEGEEGRSAPRAAPPPSTAAGRSCGARATTPHSQHDHSARAEAAKAP